MKSIEMRSYLYLSSPQVDVSYVQIQASNIFHDYLKVADQVALVPVVAHLHVIEHIVKLHVDVAVADEGGHVSAGDVEQDHVPQLQPSEPHLTLPCHPGGRQ